MTRHGEDANVPPAGASIPSTVQYNPALLYNCESFATRIGVSVNQFRWFAFAANDAQKYTAFTIPKSDGTERSIFAPKSHLRRILRNIHEELQPRFKPASWVHGFVKTRSILTNASLHIRPRWLLRLDIHDFFPSINFGRVRGILLANPFGYSNEVATAIARMTCHDNVLATGSPLAPMIANVCARGMDYAILDLCRTHHCRYSRYADDIAISCKRATFPREIASSAAHNKLCNLSERLSNIFENSGFAPNPRKCRLLGRAQRQMVTGIIVNKKKNVPRHRIRQLRAMLHAIKKFGLSDAANEYFTKYVSRHRYTEPDPRYFSRVVIGKWNHIRAVRGRHDPLVVAFQYQLHEIFHDVVPPPRPPEVVTNAGSLTIFTEGDSDWLHISAALHAVQASGADMPLHLINGNSPTAPKGDGYRLKMLKTLRFVWNSEPKLFIFDRDNDSIVQEVDLPTGPKYWGNNIWSLCLPVPSHRPDPNIEIELLFNDNDLIRKTSDGRRLFLSNEFDNETGRCHTNDALSCDNPRAKQDRLKIIDTEVLHRKSDGTAHNVALSKSAFAKLVHSREVPFDSIDFSGFHPLLEQLADLVGNTNYPGGLANSPRQHTR